MASMEERRERAEEWLDAVTPMNCSQCGTGSSRSWACIGTDPAYGADADGRRGMMAREWECDCGNTVLVVG